MAKGFKLVAELVPRSSWGINLRKKLPQHRWQQIARATYEEYGHKCGICGRKDGGLHCHEVWRYEDANQVQRLVGLIALCELCHNVKHLGHASILINQGKLDRQQLMEHFMAVNDCDAAAFEHHSARVMSQWRRRSLHDWTVDLGEYANVVQAKLPL